MYIPPSRDLVFFNAAPVSNQTTEIPSRHKIIVFSGWEGGDLNFESCLQTTQQQPPEANSSWAIRTEQGKYSAVCRL